MEVGVMNSSQTKPQKLLTEVELEMMNILWELGKGSVNDVLLASSRKLAYTSVSTILRILEQKGALTSQKAGRGHIYIPKIAKEDYETKTVKHIVDKVFDGEPRDLVLRLLGTEGLTQRDLKEIKSVIDERLS